MLRKINLMHKLFGEISDRKCKDCRHLSSYTANRKYFKCECYGESSSEATDWRLKWTACGLISTLTCPDPPVVKQLGLLNMELPVIKHLRYFNQKPREETQVEGQMSLFDLVEARKKDEIRSAHDLRNKPDLPYRRR